MPPRRVSPSVTDPARPAVQTSTTDPMQKSTMDPRTVLSAVDDDLARLTPRLDRPDVALMALARTLAQTLDAGAGMATAAVSKELRATLAALTPEETSDEDGGFAALLDQLRAPMVDAPRT